jgi:hypothetical protein
MNLTPLVAPVATSELVIWRTAEAATTIMAASIPILRVLIRDVASPSNRFYASYSRRMAAHMGSPRNDAMVMAGAEQPNPSFVLSYRSDMGMLDASGMPLSGGGSPVSVMPCMPLASPVRSGQPVVKASEVRLEYGYPGERYLSGAGDSSESLPHVFGYELANQGRRRVEQRDDEKGGDEKIGSAV